MTLQINEFTIYSHSPSAIGYYLSLYDFTPNPYFKAALCVGKGPASVRLRQRAAIIAVKNRSLSERSEFGTV